MRTILAAIALSLTACAGTPVVTPVSQGCSYLIPPRWSEGVAPAPLPDGNQVGDWIVFGDEQTAKVEEANGRTKDVIEICKRSEVRDQQAVKSATRRRLFGIAL